MSGQHDDVAWISATPTELIERGTDPAYHRAFTNDGLGLKDDLDGRSIDAATPDDLETLARPFGTSAESMLLRLVTLGKGTWELYRELKPQFEHFCAAAKDKQKRSGGGPSFYVVKARDLGPGYVRIVLDAFRGHTISSLDVADYLDVRFDQIPKLEDATR